MSVGFRASLEPSTLAASMAHEEDIAVGPRAAMVEGGSGFRPDIEGLRAVSVLLVLVYHAGVARVKGGFVGVDVFFVISGFLITGLLVRELESTGRISLLGFYARRAKRLLPATALVLVATAAATWAFLPLTDRATFATDIFSAAFYVVNWRLADRSVDYLAEDVGPSPVQHFWSLAVEEQFYIVWPLLLALAAWIFGRRGGVGRTRLAFALAFVAVPSFVWSLRLTSRDSATAFFVTTTRLWELAVGAAVAIGERRWSALSRPVAVGLGWAGLVAIACSAFLFREGARWPGFGALLPTLGAAAVIVAGHVPTTAGAARFLSLSPMVWIGGLSYSLYLWHWPLLVAARGPFQYVGYVEGSDLFRGIVDVVATDGFTGNVLLKTCEGIAESMFGLITQELDKTPRARLGRALVAPVLRGLAKRIDYTEIGGALLAGVTRPAVIAHGRSDAAAIASAIHAAAQFAERDLPAQLAAAIAPASHGSA